MDDDAARKDKLSFAIFWAMWKRDVSPPQLAKATGKSADTIRRWRAGESAPSVLDAGPLARALGVRPELFTDPPDVPDYPFADYVVDGAVDLVAAELATATRAGRQRARRPLADEAPSGPAPSPLRPPRATGPKPR